MQNLAASRKTVIQGLIIGLVLLAFTFLRPVLFFLFPFVFICIIVGFHYTISKNRVVVLFFSLIPALIGLLFSKDLYLSNLLLSFILVLPPIILFLSKIKIKERDLNFSYLDFFIEIATVVLLLSNIVGFFQLFRNPGDDDSFIGLYGVHGLAMHTLSLVNFIFCVFYFYKYKYFKIKKYLRYTIFFFLAAFACFFGLGLLAFCFTILLINFDLKLITRFFNKILIFLLIFFIILGSILLIRPQTFSYNLANIDKATSAIANFGEMKIYSDEELERNYNVPRKVIIYYYYAKVFFLDPQLFLLGNGPGTFNSRTSFLLNGDYSQNKLLELVLGFNKPQLAADYVYPLWNSRLLSKKYMDGTRNEPFSSVLAILSEYGFLFFLLISLLAYRNFKSLLTKGELLLRTDFALKNKVQHYLGFIRFTGVFILVNLFLDNYLEYPELILIFILLFNLIDLYFNSVLEKLLGESISNS